MVECIFSQQIVQANVLEQNTENIPTDYFKTKTLQIIKTVKTQTVYSKLHYAR